jgi:hypothetical protein
LPALSGELHSISAVQRFNHTVARTPVLICSHWQSAALQYQLPFVCIIFVCMCMHLHTKVCTQERSQVALYRISTPGNCIVSACEEQQGDYKHQPPLVFHLFTHSLRWLAAHSGIQLLWSSVPDQPVTGCAESQRPI